MDREMKSKILSIIGAVFGLGAMPAMATMATDDHKIILLPFFIPKHFGCGHSPPNRDSYNHKCSPNLLSAHRFALF